MALEVGTEGKLGGQAKVPGVAGTWKDLTDSVNRMAGNLTSQSTKYSGCNHGCWPMAILSKKITVDVKGEMLELKKDYQYDGGSAQLIRVRSNACGA